MITSSRYYRLNKCDRYRPPFVVGETYSNMINSIDLLDTKDFANFNMDIVNYKTFIPLASNIATLTQYNITGNDSRIAWLIQALPNIPDNIYYLIIRDTVTDDVIWISNQIEVVSGNIKDDFTSYFNYKHSEEIYNNDFIELSSFRIRQRLNINLVNVSTPFDVQEYSEISTGQSVNPRFDIDEDEEIETELFDREAHRAFAALLSHNDKSIEGKRYSLAPGSKYTGDRQKEFKVWNQTVTLRNKEFSEFNKI